MAGVYIKGFIAPINCDDCYFNVDCPHDQHIDFYKMTTGRPASCPIVPVDDHGDLIDRDALNIEMGRTVLPDSLGATIGFGAGKQRIQDAPVVIPRDNQETASQEAAGKGINVPTKSCYTCYWMGRGEELNDCGHCWLHNGEVDFEQPPKNEGCENWEQDHD